MWGKSAPPQKSNLTFKGREATTQKQFQVTELPFGQDNGWKLLSFCSKLCVSRSISSKEISAACQIPVQFQGQCDLTSIVRHVEGLPCLRNGMKGEENGRQVREELRLSKMATKQNSQKSSRMGLCYRLRRRAGKKYPVSGDGVIQINAPLN